MEDKISFTYDKHEEHYIETKTQVIYRHDFKKNGFCVEYHKKDCELCFTSEITILDYEDRKEYLQIYLNEFIDFFLLDQPSVRITDNIILTFDRIFIENLVLKDVKKNVIKVNDWGNCLKNISFEDKYVEKVTYSVYPFV